MFTLPSLEIESAVENDEEDIFGLQSFRSTFDVVMMVCILNVERHQGCSSFFTQRKAVNENTRRNDHTNLVRTFFV